MNTRRMLLGLAIGAILVGGHQHRPAFAQQPARQAADTGSLAKLNASYEQQLRDLERRRIADLAALGARAAKPEADAAYHQLFQLAIARGLYPEAQPAVDRCLASKTTPREIRALATLVRIIERADKGEFDRSLAEWKGFLEIAPDEKLTPADEQLKLAVGEAFLQRLIRAGRHDIANQLCEACCEHDSASETMKAHFDVRMARLARLNKPAPAITGTDIDGTKVDLNALKGKVVLVQFWATWCPPCVAETPQLNALIEKYGKRGFEIIGINVDAMHEDVKDLKKALPVVRKFVVEHGARWATVLNGQGADDIAKAYAVEQIPASFLVARDGKLVAVELNGTELERAVAKALENGPSDQNK